MYSSRSRGLFGFLLITALLTATLVGSWPQRGQGAITGIQRVASGLSSPMFVTYAPGDSSRLFIGERNGTIRILNLATGALQSAPFLSIPSVDADGEGGLLGMAFSPDYQTSGKFYVNVTIDNGGQVFQNAVSPFSTQIREYSVSANPNIASTNFNPILSFVQPQSNHNAGWIGFNPPIPAGRPQYLYIPTGDGGGVNDDGDGHTPGTGNAQSITNNLLGKILRINVNGDDFPSDPNRNYRIPSDNPYVGVAGDDEIWAVGMRNPFRDSFDRTTGDLWLGDVGQSTREEIDRQAASAVGGNNFGWRLREGNVQTPTVGGAVPANYVAPVYDYGRTGAFGGKTVIGGYVYRGPDPQLQGMYFFADSGDIGNAASNKFWMFDPANPTGTVASINSLLTPDFGSPRYPVAYGEDAIGNLYIVYLETGDVYRIATNEAVRGDFNRDGHLTMADIAAMLGALADLNAYKIARNLSDATLLTIGDIDGSGAVTNADVQSLLTLLKNGGGSIAPIPEPSSLALAFIGGLICWIASSDRLARFVK